MSSSSETCLIETLPLGEPLSYFQYKLSQKALETIETNWQKLHKRRPSLFNAALLRFVGEKPLDTHHNTSKGLLVQAVPDITYKHVVGLRYKEGDLPNEIDKEDVFKALSCYIFVKTKDNKVVFTTRDSGDWDPALDLPGGFIQHSQKIGALEKIAVSRTMSDLAISSDLITSVHFLGSHDASWILEHMLVVTVTLSVDFATLSEISQTKIYAIPSGYTYQNHANYFDTRLHQAAKPILETFLEKALAV